jgi:hypothetical protein
VIEGEVVGTAAILAGEPVAKKDVEPGKGRKFRGFYILPQRDDGGQLHLETGGMNFALVMRDDVHSFEEDRFYRRLPWPDTEGIVGKRGEISVQDKCRAIVQMPGGIIPALRNRAARSISSALSMASCDSWS